MPIYISKAAYSLLMSQKSVLEARMAQLKAAQMAVAIHQEAYDAAMNNLMATTTCFSVDGGGNECEVGANVKFEELKGQYTLTVTPPLKEASQAAG